jgi:hypothetical protein
VQSVPFQALRFTQEVNTKSGVITVERIRTGSVPRIGRL